MIVNVPEWAIVLIATAVGSMLWAILWAWVKGVTSQGKEMNTSLKEISKHLGVMNGRLGKSEQWADIHGESDDKNFGFLKEGQKDIRDDLDDQRKEQDRRDIRNERIRTDRENREDRDSRDRDSRDRERDRDRQ